MMIVFAGELKEKLGRELDLKEFIDGFEGWFTKSVKSKPPKILELESYTSIEQLGDKEKQRRFQAHKRRLQAYDLRKANKSIEKIAESVYPNEKYRDERDEVIEDTKRIILRDIQEAKKIIKKITIVPLSY